MEFQRNVLLAPYTSLKIGGPAEYFIEVRDRATLAEALVRAQRQGLRVTVLSGGTNVFVADRGIGGLVILMRLHGIREDGERFIADAGTPMGAVVARSVEKGLAGLSW
ncbi:MAG: FAD-binding protein, partial [Candidatus Terrybacteria bacterium]|nr:FAD-binding protein [Candidatus Terrybacteria bacterium]